MQVRVTLPSGCKLERNTFVNSVTKFVREGKNNLCTYIYKHVVYINILIPKYTYLFVLYCRLGPDGFIIPINCRVRGNFSITKWHLFENISWVVFSGRGTCRKDISVNKILLFEYYRH